MRQQPLVRREKGCLELEFARKDKPQLVRTSFFHPQLHDESGKRLDKPRLTLAQTFRWTRGAQALALFFVKSVKQALAGQGNGAPCRFTDQPERTLYEALRKRDGLGKDHWAVEIFGYDEARKPLIVGTIEAPGVLRVFEFGELHGAELHPQVLCARHPDPVGRP